jgi:hypothetical protein
VSVLVVGSLPPPAGGHRGSLLDKVVELKRSGRLTTVLSLDPLSVAHSYLPAPGIRAAVAVAAAARRHEEVVLQLEPGLPVRIGAGQAERAAALLVLGRALRKVEGVTLRLEQLDDLPGGCGGRAARALWDAASSIEAGDEEVRRALAPIAGDEKVSVPGTVPARGGPYPPTSDEWEVSALASAAEVTATVRAKAAAERLRLAESGRLLYGTPGRSGWTRVPEWEWLGAPGAGVPSFEQAVRPGDQPKVARRIARSAIEWAESRRFTRVVAHGLLFVYRALKRSF